MQIVCTEAKSALFVAYNPKWLAGDLRESCLKIIEVLPDNEVIEDIEGAIMQGKDMLLSISKKQGFA